jgi:hypothetical protein
MESSWWDRYVLNDTMEVLSKILKPSTALKIRREIDAPSELTN